MVGRTLGHYRILEKLGAGGMGEVYRARDTTLDREVALKILPPELAASQERLERFRREAKTLAALDHPNIVTVFTVEHEEDAHFLTMQLVEGQRLSELIPKRGMSLERIFDIAIPLADALAAAHEKGVIHRDLKPGNVMVTDDGRVKVLDFGLAKLRPELAAGDATELPTEPLTREGRILGTVPYMSPEQVEGKPVDHRSDVFSLGVVLHEMATGDRPFQGDTPAAMISAILRDAPPEVNALQADLPHHLGRIVRHCLEKNPEHRYQSAKDVRNELEDLRREESAQVPLPTPPVLDGHHPKETRWGLVAAAGVLLLAVVTASWLLLRRVPGGGEVTLAQPEPPMIVVLPFENLGAPEDEYFADGMTEEITSRLAVVRGLRVISRTSAMQYRESRPSLKQVGEELGVDYALEGSVRWARTAEGPGRVRISPQLIRVADDSHLWADSYDRVIEDVFEIQSDIASKVVAKVGVTLEERERQQVEVRPTENLEAYQAYLRGLDYVTVGGWTRGDVEQAIKLFEHATELDPQFVSAYSWLARAHLRMHWLVEPSDEQVSRAKAAVDRAMALAPDHPEAHLAMGYYHYHGFRDYGAALPEFEMAGASRPNDPEVLSALAYIDRREGRWEGALDKLQTALKLDPLLAKRAYEVGVTLTHLRRFEEAQGLFERFISLAPEKAVGYRRLAETHWLRGNLQEARAVLDAMPAQEEADSIVFWTYQEVFERRYPAALERVSSAPEMISPQEPRALYEGWVYRLLGDAARSRTAYETARLQLEESLKQEPPRAWWAHCHLGQALAELDRKDEAFRAAARASDLLPIDRDAIVGPNLGVCVAKIYSLTGEHEAALDRLEHLLSIPGKEVWYLWLDPVWDPLRDHPRYQELLAKYGPAGSWPPRPAQGHEKV